MRGCMRAPPPAQLAPGRHPAWYLRVEGSEALCHVLQLGGRPCRGVRDRTSQLARAPAPRGACSRRQPPGGCLSMRQHAACIAGRQPPPDGHFLGAGQGSQTSQGGPCHTQQLHGAPCNNSRPLSAETPVHSASTCSLISQTSGRSADWGRIRHPRARGPVLQLG